MKVKVLYVLICSALLSSCVMSSLSSRTTNRNLYQHGHFKKTDDFKFKRTKNKQKQIVLADNSTLDVSKELGITKDSTISETKPLEIALPKLKKEKSSDKKYSINQFLNKIALIFDNPVHPTDVNADRIEKEKAKKDVIVGGTMTLSSLFFRMLFMLLAYFQSPLIVLASFLAFATAILGIIFCKLALIHNDRKSRNIQVLAKVGLIISCVFVAFSLLVMLLIIAYIIMH